MKTLLKWQNWENTTIWQMFENLEDRRDVLVHNRWSHGGVLPDQELEEEGGDADDGEHEEVGDEECSPSILIAEVGEPPDISESNGITKSRE